jgi:hypothetical protein
LEDEHATPWSVDHWRIKGRSKKLPRIHWEWKHNLSEPKGQSKTGPKFIAMSANIKITKKFK